MQERIRSDLKMHQMSVRYLLEEVEHSDRKRLLRMQVEVEVEVEDHIYNHSLQDWLYTNLRHFL